MSAAAWRNVNARDGLVERPWPRRSGTMTRKPSGSPAVKTSFQSAPMPVPPWSSSSGSPLAALLVVQLKTVDVDDHACRETRRRSRARARVDNALCLSCSRYFAAFVVTRTSVACSAVPDIR